MTFFHFNAACLELMMRKSLAMEAPVFSEFVLFKNLPLQFPEEDTSQGIINFNRVSSCARGK